MFQEERGNFPGASELAESGGFGGRSGWNWIDPYRKRGISLGLRQKRGGTEGDWPVAANSHPTENSLVQ